MRRLLSFVLAAVAALVAGCASLPSLEGRPETTAFIDTAGTRLGRALAPNIAANPGKTGVFAVPDPYDAAAARVLLAGAAEKSIDAQYYIWHADEVGFLLVQALWNAAERGVRVRLLLDDINTKGLDPTLATLEGHPNIEVRLYNPVLQRSLRVLNFLTDFTRVNRRMHNKSFTVDNQASVVGGRNIGNEYFGAMSGSQFADLDVIAVGAAVRDVSRQFDVYWNSPSAYPAASFVGAAAPDGAASLQAQFATTRADPDAAAYIEAVRSTPLVRQLVGGQMAFEWTTARLLYDDPAKTLDAADRTDILLFPELVRVMGRPERTMHLVSPYFVPGDAGTASLVALAQRGVKVRILTNSLSSSDESVVHSGYAKRRLDLARAGVQLFEIKATGPREPENEKSRYGSGRFSALHAKTFAVDTRRIFVGSFNLDQRSAKLNTEMGLVIDSAALAGRLEGWFETNIPLVAYEVRLAADGQSLEWIERTATGEIIHTTEPATTWWLRAKVNIIAFLPIEWLL